MIVSHKYKFIFLKTNKTAGTSIEIGLSKYCGDKDIIANIDPEDEEMRQALGYRGPQNNCPRWHVKNLERLVRGRRLLYKFYDHAPAAEVKPLLDDNIWNSYYKFCFERNPWDRVISAYYWQNKRKDARPSMDEFLESEGIRKLKKSGIGVYTIDGQVVVDKICRFEEMAEELEAVRTRLGMPGPIEPPRAKSQYRSDKRPYREVLTQAQRDKIADMFAEEIALMGYEC